MRVLRHQLNNVGFEVLRAVVMKSTIFWYIMPLEVNWRFGRPYRFHIQGRRISRARYQRESRWQARACVGWLQLTTRKIVLLVSLLLAVIIARRQNGKRMSVAAGAPSPVDLLTYYSPTFPFLLSFQTKFVWQNSLLDFFFFTYVSPDALPPFSFSRPYFLFSFWLLPICFAGSYVLCHP
jgi:hypothetical protein